MLQPKTITIENKEFVITKVPAFDTISLFNDLSVFLSGQLITSDESIKLREKRMQEALGYCGIMIDGNPLMFSTKALINNHVDGFETITRLIMELMEYNVGFLKKEKSLASQNTISK